MSLVNDPGLRVVPQFLTFLLRVVIRKVAPARIARGLLLGWVLWTGFQEQIVPIDAYFHRNRLKVQISAKWQINTGAEFLIES